MVETLVSRLSALSPNRMAALLSVLLILLAIVAAELVSRATFRLLSDVDVGPIRSAVLVTAALVATPIISALIARGLSSRNEEGNALTIADVLNGINSVANPPSGQDTSVGEALHVWQGIDTPGNVVAGNSKKLGNGS